jgi:hypothetical protein
MTTEYNEAETLLTITDSKKWSGEYIFMICNKSASCLSCAFEKHTNCDKLLCINEDRKDNNNGYFLKK